ncbi:MAG: PH domain-containing protein [Bacilli bacterium]
MANIYLMAREFKRKYPMTVAWRLRANASVIEKHLNTDEEIEYVFVAQKNDNPLDILSTCVIALTNKRIVIGRKRVVFGYFFDNITTEMFNDLKAISGFIWGKIKIDTVKELVMLSNIDNKALPEIETKLSEFMIKACNDKNACDSCEQ